MSKYILSLDLGTTSIRAILFNKAGQQCGIAQKELKQYYTKPGWIEQDANEIWLTLQSVLAQIIIENSLNVKNIASIGITNQRETIVLWDKTNGLPVYKAIVWQSKQSSKIVDKLIREGHSELIQGKTGLRIDSYFSATKLMWLFKYKPELYQQALDDKLACGTIDSWIIYKLTNGKKHITDYSNASRTMMFNIHTLQWDQELLDLYDIPSNILPEVRNSSEVYGYTDKTLFYNHEIPISGIAGDQQAALFGHSCFEEGYVKNTYGTGCFLLMNTGNKAVQSNNGLLTTIAWGINGEITYALEGSIFVAGSAVQWLRDSLELINVADDTNYYAEKINNTKGVYVVPAFVGLGSPYWDQDTRGAILGLTRGSGKAEIIRATLESICYQTRDVIEVMHQESQNKVKVLRVDGGAVNNNFLMQYQADILNVKIDIPRITETTALGAAYLAGLAIGFWDDLDSLKKQWHASKSYTPNMEEAVREENYKGWLKAVKVTRMF